MNIVWPMEMLGWLANDFSSGVGSYRKIRKIYQAVPSVTEKEEPVVLPEVRGEIDFENVSFHKEDGHEILHDISFTVEPGKTLGIMGATGSGKTSLVNLIPRFYDVTGGQVLVDGVDVRDYALDALHEKLGYVPQKAVMFSGTVSSNVTYGAEHATQEQVQQAVAIAQATDFVDTIGYDGAVAQGGANLSGGQKQRLAIARAVCRKPEIYIFDDSFSALDYRTDRVLRQTLKQETAGITSLIVAQRIGTIRDADLILVLDDGKVVGQGTHPELLKSCEVYRQIALSQLSKEELEHA